MERTTVISTAGIREVKRGRTSGAVAFVEPVHERPDLVDELVGVGGEAEQLRELTDDDRHAQAHHVTDLDLLREQVGDEAQLAEPERDLDRPHEQRQQTGERHQFGRVAGDRERDDRGKDERPE
jgi:hypothetical protein